MENRKAIKFFPKGIVNLPSSKSFCHRAVICASLAEGESVINNLSLSDDISATLAGTKALRTDFKISGSPDIDCIESGSTLRFLLPIAALKEYPVTFFGQGRLMQRPLEVYENVFRASGVYFDSSGGKATVKGPMKNGKFKIPGDISSQFVSGLLLALPLLEGDSEIILSSKLESRHYVDMTINVMGHFGVNISTDSDNRYIIKGGQKYKPSNYTVEADFSQAAYFLACGALGLDVACKGLNTQSIQGDRAILDILSEMGAKFTFSNDCIYVTADYLRPVTIDAREIPDLVPPLAVLCCCSKGTSKIINAGRLRFKESDRLHALALELGNLGAGIKEEPDGLTIEGKPFLEGGKADAHGDHRIAMAMALAAVKCKRPVELSGFLNVNKSYPNFWKDFEKEEREPIL